MRKILRLMAVLLVLALLPGAACAQQDLRLKDGLTTILFAGIDRRDTDEIDPLDFRSGGQADFLLLLVLDGENITPIHIDRDTITRITTLSVLGRVSGTRRAQICLAHSFGDGKDYSARLLCEAVSRLLGDMPIDYYVTLNMFAVPEINDAIGGVEVTLGINDDFSRYDETMVPGKTIRLTGRQALYYTTRRHYVGDETNASRERRQRIYINAAIEQLISQIGKEGPQVVMQLAELMNRYASTNLDLQEIARLAMTALTGEIQPIRTIEGVHQTGSGGFMEFIPDEASIARLIEEVFYEPAD